MRALWLLPLTAAGCSDGIMVTVSSRPAVHNATRLSVMLTNDGSSHNQDLPLGSYSFPTTFTIRPEDRSGDLEIKIDAFDDSGTRVGLGTTATTIDASSASVMLDPVDFVANSEHQNNQWLAPIGSTLAAAPDGGWVVVYHSATEIQSNMTQILGRRFDTVGQPLSASTPELSIDAEAAVVASSSMGATTAVWVEFPEDGNDTYKIMCRPLEGSDATKIILGTETRSPNDLSIAARTNDGFVVTWLHDRDPNEVNDLSDAIRGAVVDSACKLLGTAAEVFAAPAMNISLHAPDVAVNGDHILYAWSSDEGDVYLRGAQQTGQNHQLFPRAASRLFTEPPDDANVRVMQFGDGFGVFVRRATETSGSIDLYPTDREGVPLETPPLPVTSRIRGYESSFGLARRDNGEWLVVWDHCVSANESCEVFGRLLSSAGERVGCEFALATTTTGMRRDPSAVALSDDGAFAVAWTDESATAPDTSGSAVRARIIYPGVPCADQPGASSSAR